MRRIVLDTNVLVSSLLVRAGLPARVDGIVSGDRHLLDLGEYRGIRILTVREFLEEMEEGTGWPNF